MLQKHSTYKSLLSLVALTLTLCCSSFFFGYGTSYLDSFEFEDIIKQYDPQFQHNSIKSLLIRRSITLDAIAGSMLSFIFIKYFSRRYDDHDVGKVYSL